MIRKVFTFTVTLLTVLALQIGASEQVRLFNYRFSADQGEPPIPTDLRFNPQTRNTAHFYTIVHLRSPMDPLKRAEITDAGGEVLAYIPDNAFVVRSLDPAAISALGFVDWSGDYHPAYKIQPGIGGRGPQSGDWPAQGFLLDVTLHAGIDPNNVSSAITRLGGEIVDQLAAYDLGRLTVRVPNLEFLPSLAKIDDVAWIAERVERVLRNGRTHWIVQSYRQSDGPPSMATPIWDQGIQGQGEIVGVIDSEVDLNHCFFEDSIDNRPGPDHRKIVHFNGFGSPGGHGTHVAGSVAGYPENMDLAEAGLAYQAKLATSNLLGNNSGNLLNTFETHAGTGAYIHTNSWGSSVNTDYTVDCVDIDTFTYQNEDHLVLFACENDSSFPLGSLRSPENAVNVLAVGATEAGINSPDQLADRHGSCRIGPTVLDGRRKPEIFSPGCGLISANAGTDCDTAARCGTSMATPITAAASALIRQYFRTGFYPSGAQQAEDALIPSGALIKAVLLNGTENMTQETEMGSNTYTDLPIPNDVEGWGRTNLENALYFAGQNKKLIVFDQRNANGLETGQSRQYFIRVGDSDEPLRCTMVFTAPPGNPAAASPVVNDLDLLLTTPDGQTTFIGNDWANGASTLGGQADPLNNVEQILLSTPSPGLYTLIVTGTAVNMGRQGFALAISGDVGEESCDGQPALNLADSMTICLGETVTLAATTTCFTPDQIQWTPSEGLTQPNALETQIQPSESTTYTLTVTNLAGGEPFEAQVTVQVFDADVDGSGAKSNDDFLFMLGRNVWYTAQSQPSPRVPWSTAMAFDFDDNHQVDIIDVLLLLDCLQP